MGNSSGTPCLCCCSIHPVQDQECALGCGRCYRPFNALGPGFYYPPAFNDSRVGLVKLKISDAVLAARFPSGSAVCSECAQIHEAILRFMTHQDACRGQCGKTFDSVTLKFVDPTSRRTIGHSSRNPKYCIQCFDPAVGSLAAQSNNNMNYLVQPILSQQMLQQGSSLGSMFTPRGSSYSPRIRVDPFQEAAAELQNLQPMFTRDAQGNFAPDENGPIFQTDRQALVRIFLPNAPPNGFACGETIIDADGGLSATILGVRTVMNGEQALWLEMSDDIGIVPVIPDFVFLKRWRPAPKRLPLSSGEIFTVPDFAAANCGVIVTATMLHLQTFVTPIPLDIAQLGMLGLSFGLIVEIDALPADKRFDPLEVSGQRVPGERSYAVEALDPAETIGKEFFVCGLMHGDTGTAQESIIYFVLRQIVAPHGYLVAVPGTRLKVKQRYLDGFFGSIAEGIDDEDLLRKEESGGGFVPPNVSTHAANDKKNNNVHNSGAAAAAAAAAAASSNQHGESSGMMGVAYQESIIIDPGTAAEEEAAAAAAAAAEVTRGRHAANAASAAATARRRGIIKQDCEWWPTCFPSNTRAINFVAADARRRSIEGTTIKHGLVNMLVAHGIAKDEIEADRVIETTSRFLQNESPLLSWFPPERMCPLLTSGHKYATRKVPQIECFLRDVKIRNLHELGGRVGSGSTSMGDRMRWEGRNFKGAYDTADVQPRERAVFGLCSLGGGLPREIEGDQFGDVCLIISGERRVREHATICIGNSGGGGDRDLAPLIPPSTAAGHSILYSTQSDHTNFFSKMFAASKQAGDQDFLNLALLAMGRKEANAHGAFDKNYNFYEMEMHQQLHTHRHLSHVVIADHYVTTTRERPLLRHIILFARKNAPMFVVTKSTMQRLVKMRLWGLEKLKTFIRDHGLQDLARSRVRNKGNFRPVCLVSGPQLPGARLLFDVICDYIVARSHALCLSKLYQ